MRGPVQRIWCPRDCCNIIHCFIKVLSSSAIAGIVAAFVSLPFDNAKTKL